VKFLTDEQAAAYGRFVEEPTWPELDRPPTRTTGASMAKALDRVDEISVFRPGRMKLDKVPPHRLMTMVRVGPGSKPLLEQAPEPEHTALLTSVVRHLEASAIDGKLVPPAWKKAVYSNPELPERAATVTRTWCAGWSSRSVRWTGRTCSPRRRTGGRTRGRGRRTPVPPPPIRSGHE